MLFSVMGSWYTQYRPALLYMKAYKQQMHKIQGAEIQAVAQGVLFIKVQIKRYTPQQDSLVL